MKKLILLSAALVASLQASQIYDISDGKTSGSLEARHTTIDSDKTLKEFNGVANLAYETNDEKLISTKVSFYGVTGLDLYNDNERIGTYLNPGDETRAIMNEAYIQVNTEYGKAKAGRFQMNSSLVDSGQSNNLRLSIPNSFRGVHANTNVGCVKLEAAWIDKMSGSNNYKDPTSFVYIEDSESAVTGQKRDSDGLFFVKGSYDNGYIGMKIEAVHVDNYENQFLEDGRMRIDVAGKKLIIGEQFLFYDNDSGDDAKAVGVTAATSPIENFNASISYNRVMDAKIPSYQHGGDPLYTTMLSENAYDDVDIDAVKVSANYQIDKNTKIIGAAGYFNGNTKDSTAVEAGVSYSPMKNLDVLVRAGYNDAKEGEVALTDVSIKYSF